MTQPPTAGPDFTAPASREVVDKIAAVPTGRNDRPTDDVVIESVEITRS